MASALQVAVENKRIDVVKELIRSVVRDINAKNDYGNTPLHCSADDEAISELLINAGADACITNCEGRSALHLAAFFKNINVMRLLIKAGAAVNSEDFHGKTPLLIVTDRIYYKEPFATIVDRIQSKGIFADISKVFDDPNIADITELLIQYGADVNVSHENNTPLHFSIKTHNKRLLELLVQAKADIHVKDKYGLTPLQIAVSQGTPVILKFLIELGADVSVRDDHGRTLLHLAGFYYREGFEFFKILIEAGVDVNASDGTGTTLLTMFTQRLRYLPFTAEMKKQTVQSLKLMIRYADIKLYVVHGRKISTKFWEITYSNFNEDLVINLIVEHVAKLKAIDVQIDSNIFDLVAQKYTYFLQCLEELEKAKSISLEDCWVTFFDLLVRGEEELTKFAGNEDLIRDFEATDLKEKFPIFGSDMQSNVLSGLERRKSFDAASIVLSTHLPIFNPTHLIVDDVLCALSSDDWKKLCE